MITALGLIWLQGCVEPGERTPEPDRFPAFERREILEREPGNQQTTNVRLAPIGWGADVELVVTESNPVRATWVGCGPGGCTSRDIPLPEGLVPVRSSTADLDGDGHPDLVLASIGQLKPTNARVGSIWVLWSEGDGGFLPERIATDMGRACCAEPGDLDGDGDLDLTVCAFGHETVGVLGWLEQTESGWTQHVLSAHPGAIHSFPVDVDGDGDLDLLTAFSQLSELVALHRNDGTGRFTREILVDRRETWWGVSGIEPVDLDDDGDVDVLLTHGDTMDGDFPDDRDPSEVHGVDWLENDGAGGFTSHRIARLWGAYSVRAVDMDGDRDRDVVVGAMQMEKDWPDLPSSPLTILRNDGEQGFERIEIPDAPPQIVSIEVADLDENGRPDVLVGSLEFQPNSQTVRLDGFFQVDSR